MSGSCMDTCCLTPLELCNGLATTTDGGMSDGAAQQIAEQQNRAWNYGDEASLYSIAEDSREELRSEAARSRAGTDLGGAPTGSANNSISNQTAAMQMMADIHWDDDGTLDGPQNQDDDKDGLMTDDEEEVRAVSHYYQNPRRLRLASAACILCLGILAIVLGLTLTNRNESVARGTVSGGVVADGFLGDTPTATPVASPVSVPVGTTPVGFVGQDDTKAPTDALKWINILSEALVEESLEICPGFAALNDPTTLQGQVFANLVQEIVASTIIEEDGSYTLPLQKGQEYIQEKYALSMLYATTGGTESWEVDTSWDTDTDPCTTDWFGIVNCKQRTDGNCGVLYLKLNSNGLTGYLPEELCCMPCLQVLYLAGNEIGGTVPQCLTEMPSLTDTDLQANQFDQGVQPTEASP